MNGEQTAWRLREADDRLTEAIHIYVGPAKLRVSRLALYDSLFWGCVFFGAAVLLAVSFLW